MKEKILVQLKTKFKDLGLSEKAFDGVAEYLSTTITEDKDIESRVAQSEGLLKVFQSENDRRTNELIQKNRTLETEIEKYKKAKPPQEKSIEKPNTQEEMPDWAKEMAENQKVILAKQKQEETLKKINSLRNSVTQKLIDEGKVDKRLCDKIVSNLNISEEDTVDTLYKKGVDEYNDFKTIFTPEAGGSETGGYQRKENHMDDYFASKKKEQEEERKAREALLGEE